MEVVLEVESEPGYVVGMHAQLLHHAVKVSVVDDKGRIPLQPRLHQYIMPPGYEHKKMIIDNDGKEVLATFPVSNLMPHVDCSSFAMNITS